MRLEASQTFRVAPGVHVREFDNELVILDIVHGHYFGLDAVGAVVWAELSAGRSIGSTADRLHAEYDVDEATALRDVSSLAEQLTERGLIVRC